MSEAQQGLSLGTVVPAAIGEPLTFGLPGLSFPTTVSFKSSQRALTVAELQALGGTPIPILTGIADSIIVPINAELQCQSRVFGMGAAPSCRLEYIGQVSATGLLSTLVGSIMAPNQYREDVGSLSGSILPINVANVGPTFANAPNPPVGAGIEIRGANMTGGTDTTFMFRIFYMVVKVR